MYLFCAFAAFSRSKRAAECCRYEVIAKSIFQRSEKEDVFQDTV